MYTQKILEALRRADDYVSGEELSQKLGITRQGLWKHINYLKEMGYEIVAVPHLGYKLVALPDRLFDFEIHLGLKTRFVGKDIYYYDTVSSTMDIAKHLGSRQAPVGSLVVAEGQTKGRGRLARTWISAKYKGIYTSLLLRPQVSPDKSSVFTLLVAVAIKEAVGIYPGVDAQIKWPNDILLEGKKLAGILTEMEAEQDILHFLVVGIGVNVNQQQQHLPKEGISLKMYLKKHIDRLQLLKVILEKIEELYLLWEKKKEAPILDRWRRYTVSLGRRVKVILPQNTWEAHAVDIDSDGGLLLRLDSGLIKKITAGDIVHCN